MTKKILIVGGGVIGLSTAYYAARKGHQVTVIERLPEQHDGCSFGNAGMIVPSHFIPLAAPGMVALGLKWMWNPESPFYIKPRLNRDLISWGLKFWKAATADHVKRSAPLIRDLSFASRALFEEIGGLPGVDFGLVKKGLVMLCKTETAGMRSERPRPWQDKPGVPAEGAGREADRDLDPESPMDVFGSVYFPKDCHLTPQRFLASLKKEWTGGGEVLLETEVTGWRANGSRVEAVQTDQRAISRRTNW